MEIKKNPRFDLERKRSTFLQIGFLTVGSLTLAAFTYKSPTAIDEEKSLVSHSTIEFQTEEIEKPEPVLPKIKREESNDDNKSDQQQQIDIQKAPDERSKDKQNTGDLPDPEVGLKNLGYNFGDILDDRKVIGEVIEIPDVDASFVGGNTAMKIFISERVQYPQISQELREEGTVWISFIIEEDGTVTNIKVERGVSEDLNNEALRIVHKFPKWIPAEVEAEPVRTRVRLPFAFELIK
jgi:protein TonB